MGYSESKSTLERIKADLQPIAEGRACQWTVAGDITAKAYAYKLREGLYIASLYPADYPELALNGPYFTIEIVDRARGIVQARPRPGFNTQVAVLNGATPTHGVVSQGAPDELMGKQTALAVVDAWSRVGHQNHKVRFPQAQLGRPDLIQIFNWSRRQEPVVLMYVTPEGALTLKHKTADNEAALAWSPEDED
jgi:hypothetical protein